ncbi:MAG: ATPase, T2SS/T4P/T4SS family, partial [Culicoidibacterales bacterium]
QPAITDISFNGTDLYVQDNLTGRRKETVLVSKNNGGFKFDAPIAAQDIELFIRKIADQKGKQFTNEEPILDTEVGNLRINAVHSEISPSGVTLAIRISKPKLSITDPTQLAPSEVIQLLEVLVKSEANIVISGKTGSGKTEFQKYLVGSIPNTAKICLLEDTMDSHLKQLYPEKDVNSWRTLTGESREKSKQIHYATLIKASLRNNPDYVIVAESRGSEAYDVLQAALTDHAIITTLHANSAYAIPARLMSMIRQEYQIADAVLGKDIVDTLKIGIHLAYEQVADQEGNIRFQRYIREVVEFIDYDIHQGLKSRTLYQRKKAYDEQQQCYAVEALYGTLSESLCQRIKDYEFYHELPKRFKEELV